jgi:two-component system sensor histidine kinase UhpB
MRSEKFPKLKFNVFWKGSTLQLLGVIILPLALLVLIFALGSTWLHQRAMRDMVGERDELAVRAAAGALSTEIHHRTAAIQGLALRASESNNPAAEILASYAFLAPDFDLGLALFSPDGELLGSTGDATIWKTLESEEELFAQASQAGMIREWQIGEQPVILFAAMPANKGIIAVGAVTAQAFSEHVVVNVLPAEREARIFIVNRDRTIVYQSGSSVYDSDPAYHPGVENALAGQSGTFFMNSQGVEHVVSYSTVPALDWALVMEEPWEAVATPVLETTRIAPLVLVPLLLVTLAGLWFGARQIVQPLRDLEQKSASLAWGDYSGIEEPVGGIAEIRHLQAELSHMAQKVQTAQRSLRDYIGVITDAQEEERRRLARELHDDTLQSIIALKQRVQFAQKNATDETSQKSLKELETIAVQTIENLRRTTRALRPIYLEDLGLVTALEMLAKETESVSGVKILFRKEGAERRLPAPVELALYRMAQEALSNVARHAQASQADLSIRYQDEMVELRVTDNGIGFEAPNTPAGFAPSGHFGLLGMYERADLIGASLKIDSNPGNGTNLKVTL